MGRTLVGLLLAMTGLAAGCGRVTKPPPTQMPPPTPTPQNAPLSFAMPMCEVPGGEFLYGPENETRDLDTFWVDKHEVTNAQYNEFLAATGTERPMRWDPAGPPKGEEEYPVRWVSFANARSYAEWLGKDLPTEEEWEKAARGTDGRVYTWGDEWDKNKFTHYCHGILTPGKVGQFPQGASPCGAEDMLGNVFEWTKTVTKRKPPHTYYVTRGGSLWSTWPKDLVVTEGGGFGQQFGGGGGWAYVGFRCVSRAPWPLRPPL